MRARRNEFGFGIPPESGQAFGGGMFVGGTHFDAEADAEVGDEGAVTDVAGRPGFCGL
jgi:hypothetical protein